MSTPDVLFVCVHNAGRSQMAASLLKLRSHGRIRVRSAGSAPAHEINPVVIEVMSEVGLDMSEEFPKPLTDEAVRASDVVITMGCGDACPIYPGKRYEDWVLDDPAGQDADTVRRIRDQIDARVQALVAELLASLARRSLAEGVATFALVFAGCGAVVVNSQRDDSLGAVGIAAAFGLVIMVMIYATGHISGAHINPAVTLAFAATRHFPARDALAYIPSQLAGAVAAALLLRLTWQGTPADLGATVPTLGLGPAVAYEFVLTAILMFVIVAVATDTRAVGAAAAIAIGGTVALGAIVGGDVTGASMNPARSFGPALVASEWTHFWIYLIAPITGALAGALAYQVTRRAGDPRG